MKRAVLTMILIATCTPAAHAVVAGTDLYLPSVAHGQGACPGGTCSQWRSDAWIYNPSSSATATVEVFFLHRDRENGMPPRKTVTVVPGETAELLDVVLSLFGLDGANGALRFVSDVDVVVTGRVYDENVVTNQGAGSAGQFFAGQPAAIALGSGASTDLVGLAQDSDGIYRTNFGFVEASGATATVEVTRRDSAGALLATRSYQLRAREAKQLSISHVGGAPGTNQRLGVRVTGGSGRILAFASRIDNRTGDPSSVEMWVAGARAPHTTGVFQGAIRDTAGTLLEGVLNLSISEAGLLAYEGLASIPCGASDAYVVDFADAPAAAIEITDGELTAGVTVPYTDGASTVFSTVWTLEDTVDSNGVISGTLRSDTSGGTGAWAACNAIGVTRPWTAGWTGRE